MFKIWSEAYEQSCVVKWLELHDYKFTAVPNDTYTKSIKQKVKNKLLWVRAWMSDLIIILKRNNILFMEMKKAKWKRWWANGSKISDAQKDWQEEINKCEWVQYVIAHGSQEAIDLIEYLERT